MKNNYGVTLMELVVGIMLIGILSMVMYPIISSNTRVFNRIQNSADSSQDAVRFFNYLGTLLKEDPVISVMDERRVKFTSGSDEYDIYLVGYPGSEPYTIESKKNSGTARILLKKIAYDDGDSKPGFQLKYLNDEGEVETTASKVLTIQAKLLFKGDSIDHWFRSACSLVDTSETVP